MHLLQNQIPAILKKKVKTIFGKKVILVNFKIIKIIDFRNSSTNFVVQDIKGREELF